MRAAISFRADQMSMLDPARTGLAAFIAALKAKAAATDKQTQIVVISLDDLNQMIAALEVGQKELAAVQLPFGM